MDLGECPKVHDLALRADYELASKDKDYYYDIEVSEQLHSLVMQTLTQFPLPGHGTPASVHCGL